MPRAPLRKASELNRRALPDLSRSCIQPYANGYRETEATISRICWMSTTKCQATSVLSLSYLPREHSASSVPVIAYTSSCQVRLNASHSVFVYVPAHSRTETGNDYGECHSSQFRPEEIGERFRHSERGICLNLWSQFFAWMVKSDLRNGHRIS